MHRIFYCLLISFVIVGTSYSQDLFELQSIKFDGNHNISSSTLKSIIYSKETPWWFWKFLNSFTSLGAAPEYFDSTSIPLDLEALEQYYNANGFFKVKFSYNFEVDTTDKEVKLLYHINESDPSTYRYFKLLGLEKIPQNYKKDMEEEVFQDTTDTYVQDEIQVNINESVNTLLNNGWMNGRFDSTIVLSDTSINKVDMDIFYFPGRRYVIDTILTDLKGEGVPYVKKELLQKLTDIKAGEYYNAEKIRRSQVRLFRTGLFDAISLNGSVKDTSGTLVPMLLAGTIGKMNELSPEFIINNQQNGFNVGLGATYIRKNFLGEARKFTVSTSFGIQDIFQADFSNLIKRFSWRDTTLLGYVDSRITIEQPYLLSKPIFATWETYATINKQRSFNATIYGSKLTFNYELPEYTLVNRLSTYYNVEVSNEVYRTNNDSLSRKLISVIGADIGRTTTDNILFPTKGYVISLQVESANMLPYLISKVGDYKYNGSLFYKTLLQSAGYTALWANKDYIMAGKLKLGHLQAYYGGFSGVPLNRTYYAGGSNSVRGWRSNQLVPDRPLGVVNINDSTNRIKGGSFIFESSIEFRYRFWESFGITLFTDYGNTFASWKVFRWDQVALAAGIGFRYFTSIAPFRLDFGWRVYDPYDKKYITQKPFWKNFEFHFGIGEAF
ncbi:MAG TPA: BamA/TamA family outer membrane protein [Ignavibacteriaceae bacterium]|nr:BamA/TamA family outer membrane protein [Ignavibacteriaceae bacterium]